MRQVIRSVFDPAHPPARHRSPAAPEAAPQVSSAQIQRAIANPTAATLTPAVLNHLHTSYGNRLVQRLIAQANSAPPATLQRQVVLQGDPQNPQPFEDGTEPQGHIYLNGRWEYFDKAQWYTNPHYRSYVMGHWTGAGPAPSSMGSTAETKAPAYDEDDPGFPPDIDPEWARFLIAVWENREKILGASSEKQALDWIYKHLYSKEPEAKADKPKIHCSEQVAGLVNLALKFGERAHLQKGSAPLETLAQLWKQNNFGAYQELCTRYYYFKLRPGEAKARLIIHLEALTVHTDFAKLLPVLTACPLVVDAKVAGPLGCLQKLDSVVVYLNSTAGVEMLVEQIKRLGLNVVGVLPSLTEELGEGIGLADEPPAVKGAAISLGQKRSIVAYMALRAAKSCNGLLWAAFEYISSSGLDPFAPAREHQPQTRGAEETIKYYLDLMNNKQ